MIVDMLLFSADILVPNFCVSCGKWVRHQDSHLCSYCRKELARASPGCGACGGIRFNNECPICSTRKFYPLKNVPVYEYEGIVKTALHSLKFRGMRNIYRNFVPGMVSVVRDNSMEADVITFVPMNSRKKAERGYNQAELIALSLGKTLSIPCVPLLCERRGYRSQRSLGKIERYINVIDRYSVININNLMDKTVLLVDDVFTTGATINECSRQLLIHGALSVFSVTVARADPEKD